MAQVKPSKKIFFNYATVAPLSPVAYKAAVDFLHEYVKLGPPEALEKFDGYYRKLSDELAKLLNCSSDEIINVKNTTQAIIIAAETIPFEKGDEVLIMENEYPSHLMPWLKKKKDGVNVIVVKGSDNHQAFLHLLKKIGPNTKAVSISWGQYYDGYVADIELLSEVCRKNNTFLVVDAAHAVGVMKVDLQKTHIDILACGGQKAIAALPGIGFLYINKEALPKLKDFKVGIRSVQSFNAEGYILKDTAERFHDGTQNLIGIVSMLAAVKHINKVGIAAIEKKNQALLAAYKKILKEANITFVDYEHQTNILSLSVSDPAGLMKFLREKNVYIKAVKDMARLSFCHDSTVKDFKVAVKYIKDWMNEHEKAPIILSEVEHKVISK